MPSSEGQTAPIWGAWQAWQVHPLSKRQFELLNPWPVQVADGRIGGDAADP